MPDADAAATPARPAARGRRLRPHPRRGRGGAARRCGPHQRRPGRRARRRGRPRPGQAGRRWAAPRPRAPTSSSSPTTTRAPRTPRPSAPPCSTVPAPPGRRPELHDVGGRAAAIAQAVRAAHAAGPGSVVAVVGKGHETGQEIAGTVHPFDDRAEARRALEACWPPRPTRPRRPGRVPSDDPVVAARTSPRSPAAGCTAWTTAAAAALVIDGPVVTDSREAGPGGLYVARVGEQRTATSSSPPPPGSAPWPR